MFFFYSRPLLLLLPLSLLFQLLAHLLMDLPLSTLMLPQFTTMLTPPLMTTLESTLVKLKTVMDMLPLEVTMLPFLMAESKL